MAVLENPGTPPEATTPAAAVSAIAILIPAWEPGASLAPLVRELLEAGVGAVVLVDDGSGPGFAGVFDLLAASPGVHLLRHEGNRGKGCALKTGFTYAQEHPDWKAVVTADADGQHAAIDIVQVAGVASGRPDRWILGVRSFASKQIPLRSRLGNGVSRSLVHLLTGSDLQDTQTGLRAFPAALLPALLAFPGERYEYEMTMLLRLCRTHARPLEVPIRTLYFEGNHSSHFHPLRDSARVYLALLRSLWGRPSPRR